MDYTKEKCHSDHGVRGLQKTYFKSTLSLTWSNEFCGGIGERGALVETSKSPWHRIYWYDNILMNIFGEEKMKTRENKRIGKLDFIFSFKTAIFGHV